MTGRPTFEARKVDVSTHRLTEATPVEAEISRELRRTIILLAIFAALLFARFG